MEDISSLNPTIDMDASSNNENEENEHILEETEIIEEPKLGMIFSSPEDVYHYYKSYAKKEGFIVAKRSTRHEDDGMVRYFTIECSRAGKRRGSGKNSSRPTLSAKTQCQAKIRGTLQKDGKFKLTTVMLEHNHTLSPGKLQYFRCNKSLDTNVKRRLKLKDQAGISVCKNFNSLVVEAGEYENSTFGEKDCPNYIEKARRLRLGEGDAQAICKYFVRMQDKNSSFFYVMDFDKENCIKNLFWADARNRAVYEAFGDVVTFDTTYLTNGYEMPLVSFVGVNHHGQSVLLGCGLVSHEDTETFVWLFQSWLACMSNCPPKAIITGECKAVQKAIEIMFPNTRHRWCLWHIMKKIPHKLSGYSQYKTIKTSLQNVVCDSFTKDEFEEGWRAMIDEYDLHDNEWLRGLYNERHRWVPIYVNDIFGAGMSTTQHSESINAFFDDYVHAKTSLKQFVEEYDKALKDKIEKENVADFCSFHSTYECVTKRDIEKQFQEAYTNAKFKEFQKELQNTHYCHPSLVKVEGSIYTFKVVEEVKIGDNWKEVEFVVYFNELECEVKCMCNHFEFRGIICRHAISVLNEKRVKKVPPKYILSRWRKDLKRDYNFVKTNYDDLSVKPNGRRYDKLCNKFYEVAKVAADSEEKCNILMSNLCQLMDKLLSEDSVSGSNQTTQVAFVGLPKSADVNNEISKESSRVFSPLVDQQVGHPQSKRKESKGDEVARQKQHGKKKKQQVEDRGTKKQKHKESSQKKVVKKAGIDDEVDPLTPNTSCMVNEIGTQDSANVMRHSYVMYPLVGAPSQFWSGGYNGLRVNMGSFINNPSQEVRNAFHPNPDQQP